MSEALLDELGCFRIAVPVPFPAAGGPVNVYAFRDEGGGLALFDAGIKSEDGEKAVRDGLAAHGFSTRDVKRIFVSHGHIDHFGFASTIQRESNCHIFVHKLDAAKVLEATRHMRDSEPYARYLAKLGLDEKQIHSVKKGSDYAQGFADGLHDIRELQGGETLQFEKCRLEVMHLPGHTPGLICLWDAEHQVLFADDHLLQRISPNPLIELGPNGEDDKFRALVTYLESARRAQRLPAKLVCPGHGEPFVGHDQLVEKLLGFYEKRQAKLLGALGEKPHTALELVGALFGRIYPNELFLQLSEVVGNLEVLEEQKRIARSFDGTVYRYALT
ncbi:MAG: MBL fold metallo-hydrolase [Deltaproteobacteria bacterium]|nr:MBL fold metallo-hydrolase [Deltaproteobacteria bacterium]